MQYQSADCWTMRSAAAAHVSDACLAPTYSVLGCGDWLKYA